MMCRRCLSLRPSPVTMCRYVSDSGSIAEIAGNLHIVDGARFILSFVAIDLRAVSEMPLHVRASVLCRIGASPL
jgi:hypothetical protein